jgi:hypothetical protein
MNIQPGRSDLPDSWLDSGPLHLSHQHALEWDHFTSALKEAGVTLSSGPDSLSWAGGDATGLISVKNLYNALITQRNFNLDDSWLFHIWHWEIPLKIKLFFWLAGMDKTLTWEMLRRRGWMGPGFCLLCRRASEDTHHLFVHCSFYSVDLVTGAHSPFSAFNLEWLLPHGLYVPLASSKIGPKDTTGASVLANLEGPQQCHF